MLGVQKLFSNTWDNNKSSVCIIFITLILTGLQTIPAIASDDFSQEDYDRAIKGEKDLVGAKLEKADLKCLDLSCADLRGAELEDANLQGADLSNANLKNADLEGANLKGAKIIGANFRGVELEYAIWIDGRVCAEGSIGSCR